MKKSLQLTMMLAVGLLPAVPVMAANPLGIDSDFACCQADWTQIRGAGVRFACIKATQGTTWVNSNFANRMAGAQAAGIYTLPYHRCEPMSNDADDEAHAFWAVAGPSMKSGGYNLSPAVDVEDELGAQGATVYNGGAGNPKITLTVWLTRWFNYVQGLAAADGITIQQIVYVNVGKSCWIGNSIGGWSWLANPGYNGASQDPQTGNPWDPCGDYCTPWGTCANWRIWQYKWSSQMTSPPYPGLSERVDLDVFNGSVTDMVNDIGTK